MLFGYLIGITIISAVSALLIKLAARLTIKKSVVLAAAFIFSLVSFLIAFFVQDLLDNRSGEQSPFLAVLPGFVFFLSCWLLNAQFVKYDGEEFPGNAKVFLVTIIQCVSLFIIIAIFSFVLISGLIYLGSPGK